MEKRKAIGCVLTAIEDDTIKGDFTEDLKEFVFDTVKTSNQAGDVSTWTIKVQAYDKDKQKPVKFKKSMLKAPVEQPTKNIIGRYYVENVTHTGKVRDADITEVLEGKNLGKKNATTAVGQAILIANKLYKDKLNKSTTAVAKQIDDKPLPMLVKKEGSSGKATLSDEDFTEGVIIEQKLDGIRAVAHITESGEVDLYSRTAKGLYGLDNITRDVSDILYKQTLYPPQDIYLDGEIYLHGKQLQDISGAVRGEGEQSGDVQRSKLKYYIFDCFLPSKPDMTQRERKELLNHLFEDKHYENLVLVEGRIAHSREEMEMIYDEYLEQGYEGAIARRLSRTYEPSKNNYHSDALVKIKPFQTDEYEVTGFKDGAGKEKGAVFFTLKTDKGREFAAVPKGMTYSDRYALYSKFKQDPKLFDKEYKGKMATVQYSTLSKLGIPQQSKFVAIRNYE